MKKQDEIESSYPTTLTPSKAPSTRPAANYSTSFNSTTAVTNEYNTTTPTATPTLLVPSSHPTDLVPSNIPTHNVTTKTSARPSLLSSVAPVATFEPTIAKVDLPSLRPSTSPSFSTQNGLAVTMTSPSSTALLSSKPTLRNEPTTSSLDGDLVFSSGTSEGDLLDVNDGDSEPNAGAGIGFGLLVVTPLVILVVGVIYEIKRRKRRRKRKKKVILPLRNTPIPKDLVMTHTRQSETSVQDRQIIRSAPVKHVARKATKAAICEISVNGTDAIKGAKEATADVATSQNIRPHSRTSAAMRTARASDAKETQKSASRAGISESLKRFKDASAVQEMRNVACDAKDTHKTAGRVGISESAKSDISSKNTSAPIMSRTSASDAKDTHKTASRVGISESAKRDRSNKDASAPIMSRTSASDAKKTQKTASRVGISESLKRDRSNKDASAPIMSRTSASDAKKTQKTASRVGISESLKREMSSNDESAVQEMKSLTGDGATFQNTQIVACAPTTSTESAGAVEKKKATTDSGVPSSLKREIVVNDKRKKVASTVVAAAFSGEVSGSSSISTQSSGSIQSMTIFAIKSAKNLGAKEARESIADATTQKDHATRQLTTNAQSAQEETVRVETSAGGESRPKSEMRPKDANAEKVTREECTLDTTNTPDEVSVQSSSSTQSSESIQSMTRFAIKSTKSVIEAKAKREVHDEGVCASTDNTTVDNATNSSRIVRKDDAATFFEMLSTLQQFFDCNVDSSSENSSGTPS